MHRIFLLLLVVPCGFLRAQMLHPHAHAHNDYEHLHPLIEAFHYGFASIEADIHFVRGDLFVSHNHPQRNAKTLEELYLKPMDSLVQKNNGWLYPNQYQPIYLLIDIKTNPISTFKVLQKQLAIYPRLFSAGTHPAPIRVIISGNRCYELILHDNITYAAIDGRPEDIGRGFTPQRMPIISDNYQRWMHWDGKGMPDPADISRVHDLAIKVHAENKKLRLLAIPDHEGAWKALLDAGVDLINTDNLQGLSQFLTSEGL